MDDSVELIDMCGEQGRTENLEATVPKPTRSENHNVNAGASFVGLHLTLFVTALRGCSSCANTMLWHGQAAVE